MSKVIFLDIDGVLNRIILNTIQQGSLDNVLIEEDKVQLLSRLIEVTGAQIVLHSGWRFWFDSEINPSNQESKSLLKIFEKYNLKIASMTPDLCTDEIKKSKKFSLVKAKEIKAWLQENPAVEKWLVIDDLNLNDSTIHTRQIRTNQEFGLTQADIEKAIAMLR